MNHRLTGAAAAACLCLALFASGIRPALAQSAGDITISAPWTRATPPGARVAGGFVRIENRGSQTDRLVSASAPIAGSVEIHEMAMDGGIMKMRALPQGLELKAGAATELKPGSYHIMFMGVNQPLKEGEHFTGELVFEKAGRVAVRFHVLGMGATAMDASTHKH